MKSCRQRDFTGRSLGRSAMTATKRKYTLIKPGRKRKKCSGLILDGLTSFEAELHLKLSKNSIKQSFSLFNKVDKSSLFLSQKNGFV